MGTRRLVEKRRTTEAKIGGLQPPPQALSFAHGRGERETRVTDDEPQGTLRRVYGGRRSALPVVSFPPSFARTFSSKERRLGTRQGGIGAGEGRGGNVLAAFRAASSPRTNENPPPGEYIHAAKRLYRPT